MSRSTALVTDAAKVAAQQDLDDYAAGVAAHMGGDWSGHRHACIHTADFSTVAGVLSDTVLRLLLTDDAGAEFAVITPAFSVGAVSTSVPPIIALQPVSQSITEGLGVTFRVYAASPTAMSYQWQYKGTLGTSLFTDIAGANASIYTIPATAAADTGSYQVIVSNTYGSVTSTAATFTVI